VSEIISGENDFTILDRVPRYLTLPAVLRVLDLSESLDRAEITVVDADGSESTFEVTAVPHRDFSFHGMESVTEGAINARKTVPPLYLKDPHLNYWFEHLEDQNMVYAQFNRVRNGDSESFAQFCHRMFTFIDDNEVEALVLDIRFNHGGNNQLLKPLIHGLIKRDQTINQEGRFYTIFGRGTFSAAISCTGWLEQHTNVRFVGEPAGSAPVHWGDAESVTLPNSQIEFWISEWTWQTGLPWDSRKWFAPAVDAPPTFASYVSGRDVAMEAIKRNRTEASLAFIIQHHAVENDTEGLASSYHEYKATHPDRWSTSETEVNRIGYGFLSVKNYEMAIAVLTLNVESYPNSANCFDSLAEAYLNSGDRDVAMQWYTKALEVNPEFANSIEMLKRLKDGERAGAAGH
jgi:tetratricopeptide (TPR) repeat protein